MHRIKRIGAALAVIFLGSVFCFCGYVVVAPEADAAVLAFDFSYTSADTVDTGSFGDTTTFQSILTNTGTEADSYIISMTENPSTPIQWLTWFCSGGVCHGPGVTQDTVYLPVGEQDLILPEIAPRLVCGTASVTMTVTSIGNPGLSKSITFLLHVYTGECPMTDRWGLLILISLIFLSGLYLIIRRLRPATT